MEKYENLLIGATCFSVGFATANKKSLIIEESVGACSDYSLTMSSFVVKNEDGFSTQTKEFYKRLQEKQLVDEKGNIHVLPINGLLCKHMLDNDVHVKFNAKIVNVKKLESGFVVEIYSNNGFSEIYAERIFDTRSLEEESSQKYYCATVNYLDTEINDYDVKILDNLHGVCVLKVNVTKDCDYIKARENIVKVCEKYSPNIKLYAFAGRFGYLYKKVVKIEKEKNYFYMPSLSFNSILNSFENGVLTGEQYNG